MKRTYLIDSENINDVWVELLQCLEEDDGILVFFTDKSAHMGYDRIIRIMQQEKGTLQWIRCFEGQNALDFQLVTEMGHQIYLDPEREYVIVSNDTGYDAAVRYWQQRGSSVSRMRGVEIERLVSDVKKKTHQQRRTGRRGASPETKAEAGSGAVQAESGVLPEQNAVRPEKSAESKPQAERRAVSEKKEESGRPAEPKATAEQKRPAEQKAAGEAKRPTDPKTVAEQKAEPKTVAEQKRSAEPKATAGSKRSAAQKTVAVEPDILTEKQAAAVAAKGSKLSDSADEKRSSDKKKRRKEQKLKKEQKQEKTQEETRAYRSTAVLEPVEHYWSGESRERKMDVQMGTLGTDKWEVAAQAHSGLELDLYYDQADGPFEDARLDAADASGEEEVRKAVAAVDPVKEADIPADSEAEELDADAEEDVDDLAESELCEEEADEDEPDGSVGSLGCREALLAIFEETGSRTPRRDLRFLRGLCRCVKLSDMSGLHNILEYQFGQETGNAIYRYIKNNAVCRNELSAGYMSSKKQRERQYLELILGRNLGEARDVEAIWKILTSIPRRNLASIHSALVKKFGQEKGANYYAVLRNHVKIIRGL
ncbi:MAG: PIN domain-containing protein [Clostridiales bacterium]|nr:PIN domain-containing protein [Clostridiales bacterium]